MTDMSKYFNIFRQRRQSSNLWEDQHPSEKHGELEKNCTIFIYILHIIKFMYIVTLTAAT